MKLFITAAMLACLGATGAAAGSCGPVNHIITAAKGDFLPDKMYFCDNQTVSIKNESGKNIRVYYVTTNGSIASTPTISDGSTFGPLVNPAAGTITSKKETSETYCSSYYYYNGRRYCGSTSTQTTYSDMYSNNSSSSLVHGMAPDSYASN